MDREYIACHKIARFSVYSATNNVGLIMLEFRTSNMAL